MQVNRVNSVVSENTGKNRNKRKSITNTGGQYTGSINNKDNSFSERVSFKGGLDSFCLGVANAIENGGLAVSFTMQDMLGTNLPRPIMGLRRNKKENNGEKNLKFALKELVREMTTGPSMFIIPMGMLAAGKKLFGQTINVPMKAIKSLGEVHAANPLNAKGEVLGKQDFYENVFTEMIKNAKFEEQASKETVETAASFAKDLAEKGDKKKFAETVERLNSKFVDIKKSHAIDPVHTDFTQAAVKNNESSFKKTVSNMVMYADDVVEKVSGNTENAASDNIKKIVNKKIGGRFAANIIMYAAVLTFLQLIPKIYNKAEGEKNAGLKGLMTEETLHDKSLEAKENDDKKEQSKPSFGSSAGFTDVLTGNGTLGKIAQGMEFEGCNVSFPLLLGIMGFGIILPRVANAKDDYDREEILRRDVTTCFTMCFAEKILRKCFSKLNETRSGFVLTQKPQGFKEQSMPKRLFNYLRPIKGVTILNSEQISSVYGDVHQYKDGIKGFCNVISERGGNLSKILSLTEESKELSQKILGEGKNLANATNEEIIEAVSKAEGSETLNKLTGLFELKDKAPSGSRIVKRLQNTDNRVIKKVLSLVESKGKTNPWIEKAKTLNARFTALSVLVLVPAFLGFFLPWFNEKCTKKRINQEMEAKNKLRNNIQNNFKQRNPKVFEDIAAFSSKA